MRSWLWIVATLLVASHSGATAQRGSDETLNPEPAGYRTAIAAAVEEYDAKNYLEAREQFRHAHELYPNARTLRALGFVEYELRNYPSAVNYLEQALASEVLPLAGNMRTEAEATLDRAKAYVGELQLILQPAQSSVLLDGHHVELRPNRPLVLPIGDHVLELNAAGYAPQRRPLTIRGRRTETLTVKLLQLAEAPPHAKDDPVPKEREPGRTPVYKRWWLWTTIGVVAASAVAVAVLTTHREDEIRERPSTTEQTPPEFAAGLPLPELK